MPDTTTTEKFVFPLRVGPYGVMAFHGFQGGEAAQVHVQCRTDDAAPRCVRSAIAVEHLYLFSLSQLCVALHRLQHLQQPEEMNLTAFCKCFSLSHNTRQLLECLPPGPETTAVCVVWASEACRRASRKRERAEDGTPFNDVPVQLNAEAETLFSDEAAAIARAVRRAAANASSHSLLPDPIPTSAVRHCFYPAYAEASKVKALYAVKESQLTAMGQSGKTSAVKLAVSAGHDTASGEELLHRQRWAQLEAVVVNRLSTYDSGVK